jgi:hypothetical protein
MKKITRVGDCEITLEGTLKEIMEYEELYEVKKNGIRELTVNVDFKGIVKKEIDKVFNGLDSMYGKVSM